MERNRVSRRGVVLMGLLFAVTACGGSDPDTAPPLPRDVRILVVNNNWLDARVYLTTGATTRSLGLITTGNEERFRVPVEFVGRSDVILVANLIGSRLAFRTENLNILGDQLIVLTLENPLDRSWITIR